MRPGLVAAPVAAALLAAASLAGCRALVAGRGPGAEPVVLAVREDVEFSVPARGWLEAVRSQPIGVPRVPTGALKVKELALEGSMVAPGDVLVVFDDTQLNIELGNNRASFRSAGRKIDRTELQSRIERGSISVMRQVAELTRDNADAFQLSDGDVFSRLEILEAEVAREEAGETVIFARASLRLRGEYYDIEERIHGVEKDQAKGKIDRVETSLANLVLKAPIGGMVVYKKNWRGTTVGVGDTLWPGNVILSTVDPTSVQLKGYVLERDAPGLEVGAAARVWVDARPDRAFPGRLLSVADLARPTERNSPVKYFEVTVEIEGGDPALLRPGMKGEARIVTGAARQAVVVPRAAVGGEPGKLYVRVLGDRGAEPRPVTLGPGDQVRVSIASGLEGGERLLLGDAGAGESAAARATPGGPGAARPSGGRGRGGGGGGPRGRRG